MNKNLIILDTGCIDLLLNRKGGKYSHFQKMVKQNERQGWEIGTTIINYAERLSGVKEWENKKFIHEDTKYLWRKILNFFNVLIDKNILFHPSIKAGRFYADLHYKIKSSKKNNVQLEELKRMHNDLWIASICLEQRATLYTTNNKDFQKIKDIEPDFEFQYIKK